MCGCASRPEMLRPRGINPSSPSSQVQRATKGEPVCELRSLPETRLPRRRRAWAEAKAWLCVYVIIMLSCNCA